MHFPLVVFDCDGVILESVNAKTEAFYRVGLNSANNFSQATATGLIKSTVGFALILTTNLIYQTPELLSKPYYINCDMSKYIALIIDTLNHDDSISKLLNPVERIQKVLTKYRNNETI